MTPRRRSPENADLPVGPVSTKYNDWDEVVGACNEVAYFQSQAPYQYIRPICRSSPSPITYIGEGKP